MRQRRGPRRGEGRSEKDFHRSDVSIAGDPRPVTGRSRSGPERLAQNLTALFALVAASRFAGRYPPETALTLGWPSVPGLVAVEPPLDRERCDLWITVFAAAPPSNVAMHPHAVCDDCERVSIHEPPVEPRPIAAVWYGDPARLGAPDQWLDWKLCAEHVLDGLLRAVAQAAALNAEGYHRTVLVIDRSLSCADLLTAGEWS